jgi:hypothetical protein
MTIIRGTLAPHHIRATESFGLRFHVMVTRNAGGYGKRGVNKRASKNVKQAMRKEGKESA